MLFHFSNRILGFNSLNHLTIFNLQSNLLKIRQSKLIPYFRVRNGYRQAGLM